VATADRELSTDAIDKVHVAVIEVFRLVNATRSVQYDYGCGENSR
jgi:hypothetical protein